MEDTDIVKASNQKAAALFVAAVGILTFSVVIIMKDYDKTKSTAHNNELTLIMVENQIRSQEARNKRFEETFDKQTATNASLDRSITKLNTILETR